MYIVFYICAKIDRSLLKSQYILLALSIIFVCIAFVMKIDNPWYGSTLCFWLGIFYYIKQDSFAKFSTKFFFCKIIVGVICLGISCITFFVRGGLVGNLLARNCASMIFVILVIMCLHKFSIGNSLSMWLGKYSYEIFLFHPLLISIFQPFIENEVLFAVVVIIGTALISYVYRKCADFLVSLVKLAINMSKNV